jgi:HD superfamily phosphohydrolase
MTLRCINALQRLDKLLQHGCAARIRVFGDDAVWQLKYSRLEHSLGVRSLALRFNKSHSVAEADAHALAVAALFHDAGHLALSHAGDGVSKFALRALTSFGLGHGTLAPHEARTRRLLAAGDWRLYDEDLRFLAYMGLTPLDLTFDASSVPLCAWLIDPARGGRPSTAWFGLGFSGTSPLAAATPDVMDLDRCDYLIRDVPPCLRARTEDAVDAWIETDCTRAERYLTCLLYTSPSPRDH